MLELLTEEVEEDVAKVVSVVLVLVFLPLRPRDLEEEDEEEPSDVGEATEAEMVMVIVGPAVMVEVETSVKVTVVVAAPPLSSVPLLVLSSGVEDAETLLTVPVPELTEVVGLLLSSAVLLVLSSTEVGVPLAEEEEELEDEPLPSLPPLPLSG